MPEYYLPDLIKSKYIPTFARICENNNDVILQKILVNSDIDVVEAIRTDNWNGGQYFHEVVLTLPEKLYFEIFKKKDDYEKTIEQGINQLLTNSTNEFVENVSIDYTPVQDDNWREKSGLLMEKKIIISQANQDRIWKKDCFRIFLSHKTADKVNVAKLKSDLAIYGIDCFVAHEDIEVSKKWADEIEKALFSMDALVAIMTETFHNSTWTDHEVGVAYGREVPILAVKMGKDPYGIIERFQALSATWDTLTQKVLKFFLKNPKVQECFVSAVEKCMGWDTGNELAKALEYIETLDAVLISRLEKAYENNSEIKKSFGFTGQYPRYYGNGLKYHIGRWTKKS